MVAGYFDGSYDERHPTIISVCGFIAPMEIWEKFDEQWRAVLDKRTWPTRLKRFHSYGCVQGYERVHGEDEFKSWGFPDRLAIYGDLVGVLLNNPGLTPIGSVLVCGHFDALEIKVRDFIGTAYHFPVQHCIQAAINKSRESWPSEEIALIFDVENRPVAEESYALYREYQRNPNWNNDKRLVGITQGSSYTLTSLQAADLLAYGSFRYHEEFFFPSEAEPDFPVIPAFSRLIAGIVPRGGIFDQSALAALAADIKEREGI
jgi:hypothetical protein